MDPRDNPELLRMLKQPPEGAQDILNGLISGEIDLDDLASAPKPRDSKTQADHKEYNSAQYLDDYLENDTEFTAQIDEYFDGFMKLDTTRPVKAKKRNSRDERYIERRLNNLTASIDGEEVPIVMSPFHVDAMYRRFYTRFSDGDKLTARAQEYHKIEGKSWTIDTNKLKATPNILKNIASYAAESNESDSARWCMSHITKATKTPEEIIELAENITLALTNLGGNVDAGKFLLPYVTGEHPREEVSEGFSQRVRALPALLHRPDIYGRFFVAAQLNLNLDSMFFHTDAYKSAPHSLEMQKRVQESVAVLGEEKYTKMREEILGFNAQYMKGHMLGAMPQIEPNSDLDKITIDALNDDENPLVIRAKQLFGEMLRTFEHRNELTAQGEELSDIQLSENLPGGWAIDYIFPNNFNFFSNDVNKLESFIYRVTSRLYENGTLLEQIAKIQDSDATYGVGSIEPSEDKKGIWFVIRRYEPIEKLRAPEIDPVYTLSMVGFPEKFENASQEQFEGLVEMISTFQNRFINKRGIRVDLTEDEEFSELGYESIVVKEDEKKKNAFRATIRHMGYDHTIEFDEKFNFKLDGGTEFIEKCHDLRLQLATLVAATVIDYLTADSIATDKGELSGATNKVLARTDYVRFLPEGHHASPEAAKHFLDRRGKVLSEVSKIRKSVHNTTRESTYVRAVEADDDPALGPLTLPYNPFI